MKYGANNSWDIEGLDEPMIAPWLIPEGYVQEYNQTLKQWRVRKKHGNNPRNGYPVEELFTFPEIADKLYSSNDDTTL